MDIYKRSLIRISCTVLLLMPLLYGCVRSGGDPKVESFEEVVQSMVDNLSLEDKNQIVGTPENLKHVMYFRAIGLGIRNQFEIRNFEDGSGSISDVCSAEFRAIEFDSEDDFKWDCTDFLVERLFQELEDQLDVQSKAVMSTQGFALNEIYMNELIPTMTDGAVSSADLVGLINDRLIENDLFLRVVFGEDVLIDSDNQLEFSRNKFPKLIPGHSELPISRIIYSIAMSGGFCVQHRPGQIVLAVDCARTANHWDWL